MCYCDECRGEVEPQPKKREKKKDKQEPRLRRSTASIRERIARCRKTSSIVEFNQVRLPDGTIVDGRGRFIATHCAADRTEVRHESLKVGRHVRSDAAFPLRKLPLLKTEAGVPLEFKRSIPPPGPFPC
jgi:hypothetical protein